MSYHPDQQSLMRQPNCRLVLVCQHCTSFNHFNCDPEAVNGCDVYCLDCSKLMVSASNDTLKTVPAPRIEQCGCDRCVAARRKRDELRQYEGMLAAMEPAIPAGKQLAVLTVPSILRSGAETYEQRNKLYGDSYKSYGIVMAAIMPTYSCTSEEDFNRLGIVNMIVSKVIRYATNLPRGGHMDSAHDLMVYAAMLAELTQEQK